MPQPRRQPPAEEPGQPPAGAVAAAAAAPTAATIGGTAAGSAAAGVGLAAGTALTISGLIAAFRALFRRRFRSAMDFTTEELRRAAPDRPARELRKLAAQEERYQREFERKMIERMRADVPRILAIEDPAVREDELRKAIEREKRFLEAREEAMVLRALGRLEALTVREDSPQGAYWKLSPFVAQHTLDCLAMGEKFWPWEVIEAFTPPVHHGCQCSLLSLDEAVAAGLMTEDDVPDPQDAVRRFRKLMKDVGEMEEAVGEEVAREYVEWALREADGFDDAEVIDLDEARAKRGGARGQLRWEQGFVKGGQFRPQRGGVSGRVVKSLRELVPPPLSPVRGRARRRGTARWLNGRYTFVPEHEPWERRIGGRRYSSPPGSTFVYDEAGKPVETERRARRSPGAQMDLSPEVAAVMQAAEVLRGRTRDTARSRIEAAVAARREPLVVGDGPTALLALDDAGFVVESKVPHSLGSLLKYRHKPTGAKLEVAFDGTAVRAVRYDPTPGPELPHKEAKRAPRSWNEFASDALAWADELGDRHGAEVQVPEIRVDAALGDHAGQHQWTGEVDVGRDTPRDIVRAGKKRAAGVALTDDELRGVWSSYWVTGHEAAHGVNPINPYSFVGEGANMEEALTEELSHVIATERLEEQGQRDVLDWRARHPEHPAVRGNYRAERAVLANLLDEAGIVDEFERLRALQTLKFEIDPDERFSWLASRIAARQSGDADGIEAAIRARMRDRGEIGAMPLPFRSHSPGRHTVGPTWGYGRFADGHLSPDGMTLHMSNGAAYRLEKHPIPAWMRETGPVGVVRADGTHVELPWEEATDGTFLVRYKPGEEFGTKDPETDGMAAMKPLDTLDRGKLILRAFLGKGSPGTEDEFEEAVERLKGMSGGWEWVNGVPIKQRYDGSYGVGFFQGSMSSGAAATLSPTIRDPRAAVELAFAGGYGQRAWPGMVPPPRSPGNLGRTGFPELDAAIDEFMASESEIDDLRDPAGAWGRCEEIAEAFAAFLKERGFRAYATSDDLRAFPGYEKAKKSEKVGAGDFTYPEHAMVEVYGLYGANNVNNVTIDFTAAQYGFTDQFPKVEGGKASPGTTGRGVAVKVTRNDTGTSYEFPLVPPAASPGTPDAPMSPGVWQTIKALLGNDADAELIKDIGDEIEVPGSKASKLPPPPPDPLIDKVVGGVTDAPESSALIPNYDKAVLKLGKVAGGSNGARWAFDEDGHRWLVKHYLNKNKAASAPAADRVASELVSNAIYRAMGAKAAEAGTISWGTGTPDFAQIPDVDIPGLKPFDPGKKRPSAGIVIVEDGKLWIYEPKGHFGGYKNTFSKGGLQDGLTVQQSAHAELWEETGLRAEIVDVVGDFEGDTGVTRYFLARRTGGEPVPGKPGETKEVKHVTVEEARELLNKQRDQAVLDAVEPMLASVPAASTDAPELPEIVHTALTYPTLDGEVRSDPKLWPSEDVGEHFMTDALLANWDFVGATFDNIMWDPDGKPFRVDQGGTLELRAQGEPKPFGPVPTEVWTMLSKGQGKRGVKVTEDGMRAQAAEITERLPHGLIDEIVDAAPWGDVEMRERVRENLKARRDWMRDFAQGVVDLPRPAEGDDARDALEDAQGDMEMFPEQEDAFLRFMDDAGPINAAAKMKKGERAPAEDWKSVTELDGLLRHATVPEDIYAYVPLTKVPGDSFSGKTVEERGFIGASLDRPGEDAPAYLRLTLPEGSAALYTQGLGFEDLGAEPELLVARGARLRIGEQKTDEDGRTYFEAVVSAKAQPKPWKGGGGGSKSWTSGGGGYSGGGQGSFFKGESKGWPGVPTSQPDFIGSLITRLMNETSVAKALADKIAFMDPELPMMLKHPDLPAAFRPLILAEMKRRGFKTPGAPSSPGTQAHNVTPGHMAALAVGQRVELPGGSVRRVKEESWHVSRPYATANIASTPQDAVQLAERLGVFEPGAVERRIRLDDGKGMVLDQIIVGRDEDEAGKWADLFKDTDVTVTDTAPPRYWRSPLEAELALTAENGKKPSVIQKAEQRAWHERKWLKDQLAYEKGRVKRAEREIMLAKKGAQICGRCGGAGGSSHWPGWTCYECNGKTITPLPKNANVPKRIAHHEEEIARAQAAITRFEQMDPEKTQALPGPLAPEQLDPAAQFPAAVEIAPPKDPDDDVATDWRAADPDHERAFAWLRGDNSAFAASLMNRLRTKGDLSPAQFAAALKSADKAEVKAATPTVPVPVGKGTEITGNIVSVKWQESQYGTTLKMLVADDRGFRVWGTVPAKLSDELQARAEEAGFGGISAWFASKPEVRVTGSAETEQSKNDPAFGFMKRPKVKLVS